MHALRTATVLHLTTSLTGGAGVAAVRIHEALNDNGFSSRLTYRDGLNSPADSRKWPVTTNLVTKLQEKVELWLTHKRTTSPLLFSRASNRLKLRLGDLNLPKEPEIVHLHWVSRWFDVSTFLNSLSNQVKIVWSLHDFNPLTGGCHLPMDCQGFLQSCDQCPQFRSSLLEPNPTRRILDRKAEIFSKRDIHLVANSDYVLSAAKRSRIGKLSASLRRIYIGVNKSDFQPRDKQYSRRLLGLPEGKCIVAFNSADLNDHNKNLRFLCEAISHTGKSNHFHLLLIGGGAPSFELPTTYTLMGYCTNPRLLSVGYSAADLFIMCSLFETYGMSSLEAQACGTPTFVADTGGLAETVLGPSQIFPLSNAGPLADVLASQPISTTSSEFLASHAPDINTTCAEYLDLYEEILS